MKNEEILKELCRLKNQINELIKVVDNRFAKDCSELDNGLTDTQIALCEVNESAIITDEQLTDLQVAVCELYEEVIANG